MLTSQLQSARPSWLDRPLLVTVRGPGGGAWRVRADGSIGSAAETVPPSEDAAHITGSRSSSPAWVRTRVPWRTQDVTIAGDEEYASRFLDAMNVV